CLRSCGGSLVASWSIASRNAASVLPEPVGAITSASLPVAPARQAPSRAADGPLKPALNHALVGAENSSSTWLTSPILTDGTDDPDTVCRALPRAGRRHGSIQAASTVEAAEGSAEPRPGRGGEQREYLAHKSHLGGRERRSRHGLPGIASRRAPTWQHSSCFDRRSG